MKTQRGVTLIMVTIALVALIGFAALAIDISNLYVARNELQNAADAGALAGAQTIYRYDSNVDYQIQHAIYDENTDAYNAAIANNSQNTPVDVNEPDIQRGHWDFGSGFNQPNSPISSIDFWAYPLLFNPNGSNFINAVKVITRREETPVNTFFSRVFGIANFQPSAQAVAVISALRPGEASLPIAICINRIPDSDAGKCDLGIMLDNGNDPTHHNTGRWTNFAQSSVDASSIEPFVVDNCSHRYPNTIVPGSSIATTEQVSDIIQLGLNNFSIIVNCWQIAANENDGTVKPWEVTLPVIDCSKGVSSSSVVIGKVKLTILWIAEDDDIKNAPKGIIGDGLYLDDMSYDWTAAPCNVDDTTCGETRWADFVNHFNILNSAGEYASYVKNSIYFGPKSCITFSTPVLVQ